MEVLLNTAEIQGASEQLKNKAGEMESAVNAANSAVGPLRGYKSPRLERDLGAWDEIRSVFMKNLESLVEAAQELSKAAQDNEAANH